MRTVPTSHHNGLIRADQEIKNVFSLIAQIREIDYLETPEVVSLCELKTPGDAP